MMRFDELVLHHFIFAPFLMDLEAPEMDLLLSNLEPFNVALL
jgi:hypothetical protein